MLETVFNTPLFSQDLEMDSGFQTSVEINPPWFRGIRKQGVVIARISSDYYAKSRHSKEYSMSVEIIGVYHNGVNRLQ